MSPLKTGIIAAVASVVVTLGALYYHQHQRVLEAGRLRNQNLKLRLQAQQSYQAQRAPASTPASGRAAPSPAASAGVKSSAPAAATRPAENYRNEGRATALAALQTFAWVCDRGDTEAVAKMLYFDGNARSKASAFMATMPEPERSKWKSVDDMAATILTFSFMSRPFPNADVLAVTTIEPISEGRVIMRLPGASKNRTQFQKTEDGWSYVIPEKMVDDYVAQKTAAQAR